MFQKSFAIVVFILAMGLAGCRSCYTPYDFCQPTFVPEQGDCCMGELYRYGSILGGMNRQGNPDCPTCSGEGDTLDLFSESVNSTQYADQYSGQQVMSDNMAPQRTQQALPQAGYGKPAGIYQNSGYSPTNAQPLAPYSTLEKSKVSPEFNVQEDAARNTHTEVLPEDIYQLSPIQSPVME